MLKASGFLDSVVDGSIWSNMWSSIKGWFSYVTIPTTYASDNTTKLKANAEYFLAQYLNDPAKLSDANLKGLLLYVNSRAEELFTAGQFSPKYLSDMQLNKTVLAARSKSTNFYVRAIANGLLSNLNNNNATGFSPVSGLVAKQAIESETINLGIRTYPSGTPITVVQTLGPKVALASNGTFVAPPVTTSGSKLGFKVSVNYDGQIVTEDVTVDVGSNGITGLPDGVYKAKAPNGNVVGVTSDQSIVSLELIDPSTLVDGKNVPSDMYYFLDVNIKVKNPGESAVLSMHFDKPLPEGYKFLKYSSKLGWYVYPNVVVGTDGMSANITLVDGGIGDDDGLVNGVIIDPGGFGLAADGTPTSDGQAATSVQASSDGGKSGGGCFIATAAYGSYLHPFVKVLRQFRDQILLTNPIGSWLVKQYYHFSPPVADVLAQHEVAKAVVRVLLIPLIIFAFVAIMVGPFGLLAGCALFVLYKLRSRQLKPALS